MHLKISVVTPNYNGEAFLEQTILSVVEQRYPNLEYILVDGASTDGSMRIVERYRDHFAHVVCEPDNGHAEALNKGLALATGDVMAWINSDDLLLPGSLARTDAVFRSLDKVDWITGRPSTADESGCMDPPRALRLWSWQRFLCGDFRHIQQESTFWRSSLWHAAGGRLDTRLRLANDFELWLRFFERAALYTVDAPMGCFRARRGQRSVAQAQDYEIECEHALTAFIDRLPAELLARCMRLVPNDQLRSRRHKPQHLPAELAAFDPPVITFEATSDLPRLPHDFDFSRPMEYQPTHHVTEDLVFDGIDRVVWRDGPDFARHELIAVEIDIIPFSPAAVVTDPLGETSPPMVCLVGPMSISDWGAGKHTVSVRFREGVVTHDLYLSEAGRRYRVKLVLEPVRYTLLLDGAVVGTGATRGAQAMQSTVVLVGGGHAQRYWLGAVERLVVSSGTRSAGPAGTVQTHMISHQEGDFGLPRQRRPSLVATRPVTTGLSESATPLAAWRNRHRGERCFVMGNGPSLNKMDLSRLAGETVFACNAAFLLFDRVVWRPTYYTCVDSRVIRDRAIDITQMLDSHPGITAFFPTVVHLHDGSGQEFAGRNVIPPGSNRHYFYEVGNRESHHVESMFSLDADDFVVQPYTVAITMLQLAVYMGFSEIYLIGCDTSYKVKESVQQAGRELDGVGLLLTSTRDDDDNHFDPSYFGQGREWHNPQVAKMLEHYRWARLAARRKGVRIVNATVGGQLEVFERVAFDSLFPRPVDHLRLSAPAAPPAPPLLSIAIPAYDRPGPLLQALECFVAQIQGRFESEVEIVVSDDCTPEDRLRPVRAFAAKHPFICWRRYDANMGLERNLLACADVCTGEYLWLFGDDDFLETDDALAQVVTVLREGRHDMLVLNRTRRSTDLKTLISPNWMGLDSALRKSYSGLRAFCLEFGFISVLGFISVNVLRRRLFQRVDASRYMGTMYPQLGAMLEAFHDRPTLLIGTPLVCHRTQTAEEKRRTLGQKAGEADFMADARRRNALFFSHPYVAMLDELVQRGAFSAEDVLRLRENTVIDGMLIDFLIECIRLNDEIPAGQAGAGSPEQWQRTRRFFDALALDEERHRRIGGILARHDAARPLLTISVVTPSFNQAEFLPDCLRSVRDQSYPAIEHLVYDPGSKDDSRAIAAGFGQVTLVGESDEGQSDALNKGFTRASGDIICWLNSDDQLADNEVFRRVVERFSQPDAPDIVYGRGIYIDEAGAKLRDAYINKDPGSLHWRFAQEDGIMQPALFMRRTVIQRVGFLRKDLHFSMDYEYWIRCVKAGIRFVYIDHDLAVARYHVSNKTYGQRGSSYAEVCRMVKEHFGYVSHVWLRRYAEFLADGHDGVLAHSQNAGVRDPAALERLYRELLIEHNGDAQAQDNLRRGAGQRGVGETLLEMQAQGLMPATMPRSHAAAAPALLGPHAREEHAHVDETGSVARLFSSAIAAGARWGGSARPGVMIDVGAHHGTALAPFVDLGWRVFAFEPDEANRAVLYERLRNHPEGSAVSVDVRAVTRQAGQQLAFFRSEVSTGISGLSAFHASHREVQHVDSVSLDTYMAEHRIGAVDFLKIDTEGHDLFVLQGFPWDRARPAVVECEFEDSKTVPLGYTFHDLARFLLEKGYTVYVSEWHPIVRYGIRHDWHRLTRYPCELADADGWGNLLAFRDAVDETAMRRALEPQTIAAVTAVAQELAPGGDRLTTIAAGRAFSARDDGAWQFVNPAVPGESLWANIYWNRLPSEYLGSLAIRSDVAASVRVTLGRHGNSFWEGASTLVDLVAGETRTVRLKHRFQHHHAGVRIQLEVLPEPAVERCCTRIEHAFVCETVAGLEGRLGACELQLRSANQLFQQGDLTAALPHYLLLRRFHGLSMYGFNAQATAKRLGLGADLQPEDLDRIFS